MTERLEPNAEEIDALLEELQKEARGESTDDAGDDAGDDDSQDDDAGDGDESSDDDDAGDDTAGGSDGNDETKGKGGDEEAAGEEDGQQGQGRQGRREEELLRPVDDTEATKKIEELKAKRTELRKKYAEGELERDDLDAQLDAINDDILEQREIISRANLYRESVDARWSGAVEAFMADDSNKMFRDGAPLNAALDAEVRKIHADKGKQHLSFAERLKEAKANVLKQVGESLGIDVTKPAGGKGPKKPANIPPGLDDMSNADDGSRDSGEFAHLDRLTGVEYDRAFAKLTPEQRSRYLSEA